MGFRKTTRLNYFKNIAMVILQEDYTSYIHLQLYLIDSHKLVNRILIAYYIAQTHKIFINFILHRLTKVSLQIDILYCIDLDELVQSGMVYCKNVNSISYRLAFVHILKTYCMDYLLSNILPKAAALTIYIVHSVKCYCMDYLLLYIL